MLGTLADQPDTSSPDLLGSNLQSLSTQWLQLCVSFKDYCFIPCQKHSARVGLVPQLGVWILSRLNSANACLLYFQKHFFFSFPGEKANNLPGPPNSHELEKPNLAWSFSPILHSNLGVNQLSVSSVTRKEACTKPALIRFN